MKFVPRQRYIHPKWYGHPLISAVHRVPCRVLPVAIVKGNKKIPHPVVSTGELMIVFSLLLLRYPFKSSHSFPCLFVYKWESTCRPGKISSQSHGGPRSLDIYILFTSKINLPLLDGKICVSFPLMEWELSWGRHSMNQTALVLGFNDFNA